MKTTWAGKRRAIRNRRDYLLRLKNDAIMDLHQEKGKKRPSRRKITELALAAAQAELDYIRDGFLSAGWDYKTNILDNALSLTFCLGDLFPDKKNAINKITFFRLLGSMGEVGERDVKKKR